MVEQTVALIFKGKDILWMMRDRKQGDVNLGKWIGVGGHVEEGETPDLCNDREIYEETKLQVLKRQKYGIVYYCLRDKVYKMHVYRVDAFSGVPDVACDEGYFQWFSFDEWLRLPHWLNDELWVRRVVSGEHFGYLVYRFDGDRLLESRFMEDELSADQYAAQCSSKVKEEICGN